MLKAFKYKINPTNEQTILLNKHIGSSRFVYNLALETKNSAYVGNKVNLSCFALHKQLTELKTECEWTCKGCGTLLNRDVNAAINIKNFALRNYLSGTDRKNQGKLPTLVGALTLEAHPIASGVGG